MRRALFAVLGLVAVAAFAVGGPVRPAQSSGLSSPVIATITLPAGSDPTGIAFDENLNKLFVADDTTGNLLVVDGTSRQVVGSVFVGKAVYSDSMFVDEAANAVYVASEGGLADGSGLISVVNASTGNLVTTIDPAPSGYSGTADFYKLAGDAVHGKVYASLFCPACSTSLGVINVSNNSWTPVLTNVVPTFTWGFGVQGVNTVTNEAFAVNATTLYVVHGDTLQSDSSAFAPYAQPLSFAVNEVDNKLYFWFNVNGPLVVLDRGTNQYTVLDDSGDEEPLVFNQASDQLFTGAQIADWGDVVDGATDAVTHIVYGEGGMGAGAVRASSDNAYFATTDKTFVVNGNLKQFQAIPTGHTADGGIFAMSVAVDQQRGLVYVVNDDHEGVIRVIQDGPWKTATVSKSGSGSGSIASSPAGIDCGSTCSHAYVYGTQVTLTATPATGSTFTGWSGACTGTGTCTLAMDADRSVTATFGLTSRTLSVDRDGAGSGTISSAPAGIDCGSSCSHNYPYGTSVTLTAAPADGSTFEGWTGDCYGTGTCTLTMNGDRSVTATFELADETLTVTASGSGSGTVTSNPLGILCWPGSSFGCSTTYPYGTEVTLTAAPDPGSTFTGWGGACTGTGICTLAMNGDRSVTATFTLSETLTVARSGSGSGTVTSNPAGIDCGATCWHDFPYGTMVTLTPSPGPNSTFSGWSGDCNGTGTCTLTMNGDRSVTATFALNVVPKEYIVPNVKGKKLATAKRAIVKAGCRVGKIRRAYSARVKKGRVISQHPAPRTRVHEGAKVSLLVSKGKRRA
ncbi:MAG: InlB B-repeat-containing protein [Gaiellaceae bacterium]